MKDTLIFTFHREGCAIAICTNGACLEMARLSAYDLLHLGIEPTRLFAFMEYGTELRFLLEGGQESTPIVVPRVIYEAFTDEEVKP